MFTEELRELQPMGQPAPAIIPEGEQAGNGAADVELVGEEPVGPGAGDPGVAGQFAAVGDHQMGQGAGIPAGEAPVGQGVAGPVPPVGEEPVDQGAGGLAVDLGQNGENGGGLQPGNAPVPVFEASEVDADSQMGARGGKFYAYLCANFKLART